MDAGQAFPDGLDAQVADAVERLEQRAGKRLGDPRDPLLVSVRSGATESMPGMLDTVLNLGLNDESVEGLARSTGDERFAWDSFRRLAQMYGNVVVAGVEAARFETVIRAVKEQRGVEEDAALDVEALRATRAFRAFYRFPSDPREQLQCAIRAVFGSWTGERAVQYRRINHIPDDWGTAVNAQQMVFGNKGDTSGSGVAFSRNELTGEPEPSGDYLPNAQGEDVVSGARTPRDIAELKSWLPDVHEQLTEILRALERHYGDMQDTEFTVEDGKLYMLQTRSAKRPARPRCASPWTPSTRGCSTNRRRSRRSTPSISTRCCIRPSTRLRATTCWPQASLPRRAPPRARSSSWPAMPSPPRPQDATSSWHGHPPRPTTSPASTPPSAY